MKKFILFIFIGLLLLSACSKSEQEPPGGSDAVIPDISDIGNSTGNSVENSSADTENSAQISEPDRGTEPVFDAGEIIISQDPKNYLKASFDGNKISVSGKKTR